LNQVLTALQRSLIAEAERAQHMPIPEYSDFLGRMPIPLRRPFKAGLDRTVIKHRENSGIQLKCCFLSGAEWYHPFDELAALPHECLPATLLTPLHQDILSPDLLAHYAPSTIRQRSVAQIAINAGLLDPYGIFNSFAAIPFVFLVDERRLKRRTAPKTWQDLLDPQWQDEIVFGGWRPNEHVPYQEYNSYILFSIFQEYGAAGLAALAANVKHLQHNIRTATLTGTNSQAVGTIAILPWLQASLCPRRERTRVVWPEDGAIVMPIGYLVKHESERRVQPILDYMNGSALARVLSTNCYPPLGSEISGAFPANASMKWAGWDYIRSHDMAAESALAARIFFGAWAEKNEVSLCS